MLRSELDQISEKMKDNELKQVALRVEKDLLEEHRDDLIRKIILEEKLLENTEWELELAIGGEDLYLEYASELHSPQIKPIIDLCWHGWHSEYPLDLKYQYSNLDEEYRPSRYDIHFDDGRITIWFDSPEFISEFIQTYGIKIMNNALSKAIVKARSELDTLEKLGKLIR